MGRRKKEFIMSKDDLDYVHHLKMKNFLKSLEKIYTNKAYSD